MPGAADTPDREEPTPASTGERERSDPEETETGRNDKDPSDDLVTTSHSITVDGEELRYTATARRIVLRSEGHTDDKFDGPDDVPA
jgi:hypothetical protein